ncbi:hypothetical protein SAMN05421820_102492 [Pedobacter steynii]|uniref:Uncharacterized protein n=1 Tax=Pedobacter steynii TaxID=430522 RepID=A0A1G9NZY3_9SPHI|nr:hypothetical protein [Pedobacter steynii]NQX39139.1 hypothetical protein [Pedobacter steynii]SDL91970.1 hypothetical protein SAMN05421820_102492 [Pedobacter steynii]
MDNRLYILKCIALIAQKADWGETHDWVDYHFKNLSDQIFESTKVSISVRTLKRIIRQVPDAEGYYEPQMATKNALAVYLGFHSWADFKRNEAIETDQRVVPVQPAASSARPKKRTNHLKRMLLILIVPLCITAYPVWNSLRTSAAPELTIKKMTGNNIALKYDLKTTRYNNATIDLDYGFFRPLVTPKGEFTYFFKLPDHYRLKLLTDGITLASRNIHIVSNGWKCVVQQGQKEVLISDSSLFFRNQALSFRSDKIRSIGLDPFEVYWTDYRNIKDFNIDGDNLIIELDIRNNLQGGGMDCFDSSVEYLGEFKTGRVKFVKPGCTQFASFDFGEVHYNGNFHDLKHLGIDLSQWRSVRIEVIKKQVHVFTDGILIYKNSYEEPIGKVKGIKCKFKGAGTIDNFRIMNLERKVIYGASFEDKTASRK